MKYTIEKYKTINKGNNRYGIFRLNFTKQRFLLRDKVFTLDFKLQKNLSWWLINEMEISPFLNHSEIREVRDYINDFMSLQEINDNIDWTL